jgi:hypothetical protein
MQSVRARHALPVPGRFEYVRFWLALIFIPQFFYSIPSFPYCLPPVL